MIVLQKCRRVGDSYPSIKYFASASNPSILSGSREGDYESAKPYDTIPLVTYNILNRLFKKKEPKQPKRWHIFFERNFKELNTDIFVFRILGVGDNVFIQHPEDFKTVISNEGKHPREPAFDFFVEYRQKLRRDMYPGTGGLLGSVGDQWYQVRSKVQQDMLRPKSALYYIDDIKSTSDDFLDLLESNMTRNQEVPDVTPFIYRWALESVGAIFLNSRIGCLNKDPPEEAKAMIKNVEIALGESLMLLSGGLPLWKLFKTKPFRDFDKASEVLFHVASKLIADSRRKIGSSTTNQNKHEKSVLEKLIVTCGEDSDIPQVMAMDALFAGIDTTGNAAAFLLYHLASNPEQQEILHKEIQEKLGYKPITPDAFNDLKYLKAVQHESMRLLPAVGGLTRIAQKNLVLSGYQVPQGTKVSTAWVPALRSERNFEQADKFIPERWLRGCPQQNNAHPFAFMPFGHGARMCIGRRFAELEMQILVIQTIRRYRLEYNGPPLDMITPFINRPDAPVSIRLFRR